MRNAQRRIGPGTIRVGPMILAAALLASCSHTATPADPVASAGQGRVGTASPSLNSAESASPPTPPASLPSTAMSTSTPPPTTTASPTTNNPVVPGRRGTVVLVPGYGGSTKGLATIAATLRTAGRRVRIVALPAQASQLFEQQARTLEAVVSAEEKAGRGPVDIVAHSNGGVLARYWARHYKGAGRVRVVVTLGSPQHGTTLADLAFTAAPQMCTPACGEVRPSSAFLTALNKQPAPAGIAWVSVYTDNDDVVTPPTSAVLRGAVNVRLQSVCADALVHHSGLLGDPLTLGVILDELQSPVPHAERAADCMRLRTLGS